MTHCRRRRRLQRRVPGYPDIRATIASIWAAAQSTAGKPAFASLKTRLRSVPASTMASTAIAPAQRVRQLPQLCLVFRRGLASRRQLQVDTMDLVDLVGARMHDVEGIERPEQIAIDRELGAEQGNARQPPVAQALRRDLENIDDGQRHLALQVGQADVRRDGGNGEEVRPGGRKLAHKARKIGRQVLDAPGLHQRQGRRRMGIRHRQPRDEIPLRAGRGDPLIVEHGRPDTQAADQSEVLALLHGLRPAPFRARLSLRARAVPRRAPRPLCPGLAGRADRPVTAGGKPRGGRARPRAGQARPPCSAPRRRGSGCGRCSRAAASMGSARRPARRAWCA